MTYILFVENIIIRCHVKDNKLIESLGSGRCISLCVANYFLIVYLIQKYFYRVINIRVMKGIYITLRQ